MGKPLLKTQQNDSRSAKYWSYRTRSDQKGPAKPWLGWALCWIVTLRQKIKQKWQIGNPRWLQALIPSHACVLSTRTPWNTLKCMNIPTYEQEQKKLFHVTRRKKQWLSSCIPPATRRSISFATPAAAPNLFRISISRYSHVTLSHLIER